MDIVRYSGFFGILIMWMFMIVLPTLLYGFPLDAYSDFGVSKKYKYALMFNCSFTLVMLLQIVFIRYITTTFSVQGVGYYLFALGSLSGLIASFVNEGVSLKLHFWLGMIYFALSSIGAVLISLLTFTILHSFKSVIPLIVSLIMVIGCLVIYRLTNKTFVYAKSVPKYSELWMFTFSSIWVISIYQFLL